MNMNMNSISANAGTPGQKEAVGGYGRQSGDDERRCISMVTPFDVRAVVGGKARGMTSRVGGMREEAGVAR